ncbi:MAG: M23 family metallopeptidase [Tannerellaceae bacterium]|nr:M23 family metallopeptidase [Tannerellaceae bacterium]
MEHWAAVHVLEDAEIDINRIDITESFTAVDLYEFNATDAKLFALDNKILIDLTRIKKEEYAFPLPGAKLLSEYAGRRVRHTGVDLKVARKDTVLAAFDGIVRISRSNPTYGNVVVIHHYNGLETLYSHNTKNLVKVGERVKAGQAIATTGQTGRASTDHLHFETRINGQHFNPNLIFNFQTQELNDKTLLCVKSGNKVLVQHVDPFPAQTITAYNNNRQQTESGTM